MQMITKKIYQAHRMWFMIPVHVISLNIHMFCDLRYVEISTIHFLFIVFSFIHLCVQIYKYYDYDQQRALRVTTYNNILEEKFSQDINLATWDFFDSKICQNLLF